MANGDIITIDQHRFAAKLLDAQSASDNGQWIEIPVWYNIRSFWSDQTTEVSGSPKVEIMVSNALTRPANATDGVVAATLDPATATSMEKTILDGARWVKAKKTAGGTPAATTCIVEAARNE